MIKGATAVFESQFANPTTRHGRGKGDSRHRPLPPVPETVAILGYSVQDGKPFMYEVRAQDGCTFFCAPWELRERP